MRLGIRIAVVAGLLAVVAFGLVWLRTDTFQAGNRLHRLFGEKRVLEKACCRLELQIAALRNQERLRQQATDLLRPDVGESDKTVSAPHKGAVRDRPVLVDRGTPTGQ
jgi:cell division protein FtsL